MRTLQPVLWTDFAEFNVRIIDMLAVDSKEVGTRM